MSIDEFGPVLHQWKEQNAMPWGQLRYHSSWRNIAKHAPNRPLRILDIGGGDGVDAVHYARLGHSVSLSDCSSTMLAEARIAAEQQGVLDRIRFYLTGTEAVPDLSDEQPFDLILCHMMIEFVPDALALLSTACKLLSSGGLLSILDTNRYSDVYLNALQLGSLQKAIQAIDAREYFHPWVNRPTPRFSAEEFIDKLDRFDCSLAGNYGVLNICAYLPNEPKSDPQYYSELEKLEYGLADTYPYYLLARFFQVIAQKK